MRGIKRRAAVGWLSLTGAMLAAAAGGTARAETKARDLSLEAALSMARKANRSLLAERSRLAQARTNLETAWASLFPTVTAQGRYTRNNIAFVFAIPEGQSATPATPPTVLTIQPKNQLDGVIAFTAPLVAPPAYLALKAVRAGVDASSADYESSLAATLFAVAQAYQAAAISEEVVAARQSSIDVARVTLQNAQTRFGAGTVTKVDVDRAELALVRAEQAAREARLGREQAYRALGTLIQADGPLKVSMVHPSNAVEPDDLDTALRLRPEFHALELATKSFSLQRQAQGWRWSPTLSAFGNARLFNYDNFATQRHSWAVGLQLDWMLYDGGVRDADRHRAAAQQREAAERTEMLRDAIRDDLANNRGLLETKRYAHAAAERQVDLAAETLDLVRIQYEAGNAAQIDLLQAQDGLTTAKEALAQAHYELAMADLALRRSAGTFPGDVGR